MSGREYPQRGDWVHVCEGGTVHQQDGAITTVVHVLSGADLVCQGRAFEWANEDCPDYRTDRPSVWVHSHDLGMVWVEPSSWVPVEGPPVADALPLWAVQA